MCSCDYVHLKNWRTAFKCLLGWDGMDDTAAKLPGHANLARLLLASDQHVYQSVCYSILQELATSVKTSLIKARSGSTSTCQFATAKRAAGRPSHCVPLT